MISKKSFVVRSLGAAATLAAVAFCSLNAQAVPISVYSNPFSEVTTVNTTVSGSNWFASGFNTGTNANFLDLTSVSLSLATSGTNASSSPVVKLYSGTAAPTSLISLLSTTGPVTSASPVTVAFTPSSSPLTLLPSTNYWVVVSANPGDAFGWYLTDSNGSAQNDSSYSFVSGLKSSNAGSSYSSNLAASVAAVTVEAVPEPSTVVMAGLGIAGAAVLERKRRHRRKARLEASESDDYLG